MLINYCDLQRVTLKQNNQNKNGSTEDV